MGFPLPSLELWRRRPCAGPKSGTGIRFCEGLCDPRCILARLMEQLLVVTWRGANLLCGYASSSWSCEPDGVLAQRTDRVCEELKCTPPGQA
jgi:hypothetical protein